MPPPLALYLPVPLEARYHDVYKQERRMCRQQLQNGRGRDGELPAHLVLLFQVGVVRVLYLWIHGRGRDEVGVRAYVLRK